MPNFRNRTLYHGDNLDFLRGMDSETVHLIATDPPFNKNRDFHATPDSLAKGAQFQDRWSWQDDLHDDWLIAIQRDEPEVWQVINAAKTVYGDDMAAFLCWMGVRLLEMHRILRDDGSIYIHCDQTASHYLKALMDAVFGARNFQSDITWKRTSAHSDSKRFGQVKDTLLYYSKSGTKTWNRLGVPHDDTYVSKFYRHTDEQGIYRHHEIIRTASMGLRPNLSYEYQGYTPPYGWRMERGKLEALDNEGRLVWSDSGRPYRKTYLTGGQPPTNLWTDIHNIGQSKGRTGYPTQKPLALYERIIAASSNREDLVLDPFCGCATTPIAAERLGRQWVGMDIWDGAHQIVLDRLEAEGLAVRNRRGRRQGQQLLTFGDIHYETKPPKRTDAGEPATLVLRTPTGKLRERGHPAPRSQHGRLLTDIGAFCQGCGRDYNFDPRVLEVDHIRPRSDGGSDAYDNLTLLCPPCNKEKRDRMTLTGLQAENRRTGHLQAENERNIRHGRGAAPPPARRRRRR